MKDAGRKYSYYEKRKGGRTVETVSGYDTTHIVFVWHGWMRGIYHAFSDETNSEYRKPVPIMMD